MCILIGCVQISCSFALRHLACIFDARKCKTGTPEQQGTTPQMKGCSISEAVFERTEYIAMLPPCEKPPKAILAPCGKPAVTSSSARLSNCLQEASTSSKHCSSSRVGFPNEMFLAGS